VDPINTVIILSCLRRSKTFSTFLGLLDAWSTRGSRRILISGFLLTSGFLLASRFVLASGLQSLGTFLIPFHCLVISEFEFYTSNEYGIFVS
jgi:hypothetical protein